MSVALDNYTYPYLLWHGTAEGNVDSILDQGLRPRGPRRGYQRQRPVWFYNSAEPYLDKIKSNDRPEDSRGMVCAVEWSSFELGVDFSYESPQVVTVYRSIPAELILGTFPCTEVADLGCLAQFLHSFLGACRETGGMPGMLAECGDGRVQSRRVPDIGDVGDVLAEPDSKADGNATALYAWATCHPLRKSFSRLCTVHTRPHSSVLGSRPRTLSRSNDRADLICPNTGSTICLRSL